MSPTAEPMPFHAEREAVAAMMRQVYALRLTTASGGNISVRLPGARCAITPSGGDKSATRADQIAIVTIEGEVLTPEARPSSEFKMHTAVYRRHARVGAVVHAHPPTASVFTACAAPIRVDLTAEGFAILRRIEKVPYALTSTEALGENVAEAAARADCLLLENHGVTTLGANLMDAFHRLEVLEAAAWQTWLLSQLGPAQPLTQPRLDELARHYGFPRER